jgi:membrane-associated protease RseP (regulator of RpoE activity)
VIHSIVSRVLAIQDVTVEDDKKGYFLRYRGRLRQDSVVAYDQLSRELRPLDITPLFRREADLHTVLLTRGVIRAKPGNPLVNLVLFVLTAISVLMAGVLFAPSEQAPMLPGDGIFSYTLRNLRLGIPFAATLLTILTAHEFGHYLAGRFHKVHVTLPYFIPMPPFIFPNPFGTMGAVIQLKEPPRNRRFLMDIGIAGPLAGFVLAVPLLILGLSLSDVQPLPANPEGLILEGNSLLYLAAKFLVFGRALPEPATFGGLSPLLYWVRYFFTGSPLPLGGEDVLLHPVAMAAWGGLLVTAINLIPAGQLDGGHLLYVLVGKRARAFWPFILGALVLLGFAWMGWWLWAAIIFLLGRLYAEPLDQITELDPKRKLLAVVGLIIFFLVFTPVPMIQILP